MATPAPTTLSPTVMLVVACGASVALIGFGVRAGFGLFNAPISNAYQWNREVFALAMAIQNLVWGMAQPVAGAFADRFGPAWVLTGGAVIYGVGTVAMAFADTPVMFHLIGGVLVGLGIACSSFILVVSAFGRLVPASHRSWAAGIGTAAGSFGQFVFAFLGERLISGFGWVNALLALGAVFVLVPLLARALAGGEAKPAASHDESLGASLREALGHPSYRYLAAGFFVCGLHVAFVGVHLPAHVDDVGLPSHIGSWALALIGLANVVGSYLAGVLGGRHSKRWLLSLIYGARAVVFAAFALLPPTAETVLLFAVALGFLWLSTVPPTSGLVATMFGTRHIGTLFGLVFLMHQIGSFLGIWLGGVIRDATGSYDLMWWIQVAFGVFAALIHLPIVERPVPRLAAVGA
jgi:MFS family permease